MSNNIKTLVGKGNLKTFTTVGSTSTIKLTKQFHVPRTILHFLNKDTIKYVSFLINVSNEIFQMKILIIKRDALTTCGLECSGHSNPRSSASTWRNSLSMRSKFSRPSSSWTRFLSAIARSSSLSSFSLSNLTRQVSASNVACEMKTEQITKQLKIQRMKAIVQQTDVLNATVKRQYLQHNYNWFPLIILYII